ncbi:MAG: hypothetical protein R3C16_04100 [Hyphomonadaceae bacterium]
MRLAIFAAALALCGFAAPAAAQPNAYETQVRSYLEHGLPVHEALGYRRERSIGDVVEPLTLDRPFLWAIPLRAGVTYRIYGACDDDCSDLDMEIYGADGRLADRDVGLDDIPYVQITPIESGPHYVRIWLYACDVEPCYAGARVVSGGTPAPRQSEAPAEPEDGLIETDAGYTDYVRSRLDDHPAAVALRGFSAFGEDAIAPVMLQSQGYTLPVMLERRRDYVFLGACDQDCADVNMELVDDRGRRVASDETVDNVPALAINPGSAGEFTLRIWLAQCSVEPCYVGVRGYQR